MIMYSKEIHNQNYFDENDIERSGISKTPNVKLSGHILVSNRQNLR